MSELEVVLRQGYFLEYSPTNKKSKHRICGEHNIKGADCPNCDKPLHRFASLDLNDKKIEIPIQGITKLHILYCWRCNVAQDDFFYKLIGDEEIEILEYGRGIEQTPIFFQSLNEKDKEYWLKKLNEIDFPYKNYPDFFPGAGISLKKIPKRIQEYLVRFNSDGDFDPDRDHEARQYDIPKHQIGGEPYLVQCDYTPSKCPECQVKMPLLATIGDDCLDERGFGGNTYAQVIYGMCVKCKIISAYQQCD